MKEQKLNDSILKLKDEDKLEDDLFYLNKRTIKKIKKLKKIKKIKYERIKEEKYNKNILFIGFIAFFLLIMIFFIYALIKRKTKYNLNDLYFLPL